MLGNIIIVTGILLLIVIICLMVYLLSKINGQASLISSQKDSLENIENDLSKYNENQNKTEIFLRDELFKGREESNTNSKNIREELNSNISRYNDSVLKRVNEMSNKQENQLGTFSDQLSKLTQANELKLESMRETIEKKLALIQQDNNEKLEKMRATVDEKLHETLEKRLGESFQIVSDRLDLVHKGLGEMQTLAIGVGDLKKVLTNVKTRGTWGEVQLGNLLEQIMTNEQYDKNVITKKGSRDPVEYAIKLPGKDKNDAVVYLPIDSKFPKEDYERLIDAQEKADINSVDEFSKRIEGQVKGFAKDIRDKYLDPPNTTDFGIMFLPTEGLYAEVLRRAGLVDILQREYRVIIAGPTTLMAILNSLQMGFRTLAVEKRSSEVWLLLGAVKTEFTKFGEILDKTQKKLQEASNTIENASKKSKTIEKKLKDVQELPIIDASQLLPDTEEIDKTEESNEEDPLPF